MENTTRKTMTSVIWHKLVDTVDRHSFLQIGTFLVLSFIAGIMSSFAVDGGSLAMAVLSWRNHAIPNIVTMVTFVFCVPWFARKVCMALLDIYEHYTTSYEPIEDDQETVHGVPVTELLDYLFTVKTFKRDDVESRFKIPRYKYTMLTKAMKKAGVLVHGINNQTVLADGVSRAYVAGVLTGDGEPVTIVRPIPSPVFKTRRITLNPIETDVQPVGNLCATV